MHEFGERLSHLSECVSPRILTPHSHWTKSSNEIQIHSLTTIQPSSSTLHIHPLAETYSPLGDQMSIISSTKQKPGGVLTHQLTDVSRCTSTGWHSDISFEPVSSDYAMLKIHELPSTAGDTLWALGYEVYDRLLKRFAGFLEDCTASHEAGFCGMRRKVWGMRWRL